MNTKPKQDVAKCMNTLPRPTSDQLFKLEERIKKHRAKSSAIDDRGLFGTISKLFR